MTLKTRTKNNPIIRALNEFLLPYGFKKCRSCCWYLEGNEVTLLVYLDHYYEKYDIALCVYVNRLTTPEFLATFNGSGYASPEDWGPFNPKRPLIYQGHFTVGLDLPDELHDEQLIVFSDQEDAMPDEERIAKIKEYLAKYGMETFMQCRKEENIIKFCLEKREGFAGCSNIPPVARKGFRSVLQVGECYGIHLYDEYYAVAQVLLYAEDEQFGYLGMMFLTKLFAYKDSYRTSNDPLPFYKRRALLAENLQHDEPMAYGMVRVTKENCSNLCKIYRPTWQYIFCELKPKMLPDEFKRLGYDKKPLMSEKEWEEVAKAYHGLLPWDLYPEDPTKFDRLLLHPDQKPTTIKYRKDFIEQPDGNFILKDKSNQ